MWEEPCISGKEGSGTVFFTGCNLRCVYCQNYDLSRSKIGMEITEARLAEIFLKLQDKKANNINLVTPTHFIPQIIRALQAAKTQGLCIPVVYNSSGYESFDSLKKLEGLVDIYLPDFKYWDDGLAKEYSGAPCYREYAMTAITEMRRQQPGDVFHKDGTMRKGLILRHLVLPGHYKDSLRILDWVREALGAETIVSLMSQYTPAHRAKEYPLLSRRVTTFEYEKVVAYFWKVGLKNGYMQRRSSAGSEYTPLFDLSGVEKAGTQKD